MSTDLGKIWVFDESKLDNSLEKYQEAAIEAYPQHEDKITMTLLAVKDFLHSEYAENLIMHVNSSEKHHEHLE